MNTFISILGTGLAVVVLWKLLVYLMVRTNFNGQGVDLPIGSGWMVVEEPEDDGEPQPYDYRSIERGDRNHDR